jgi:hypothetical protein
MPRYGDRTSACAHGRRDADGPLDTMASAASAGVARGREGPDGSCLEVGGGQVRTDAKAGEARCARRRAKPGRVPARWRRSGAWPVLVPRRSTLL